jgi:cytoskeletal protein RodZ
VYARGHIRTLAKVSGIDPDPLVAEFDRLHEPAPPSAAEIFESDTYRARERRGPNWSAAMAAAVVLLLGVAGFQLLRGGSGSNVVAPPVSSTPAAASSATSGATGTSSAASSATTSPTTGPTVIAQVPPSSRGVTMRLAIVGGRSWVSVTAGSRKVFEGVLSDGATRTFTDPKQVKIIIGNAGAAHLVVNGVDLGTAGGSGQVVRLTFGPGDPSAQG